MMPKARKFRLAPGGTLTADALSEGQQPSATTYSAQQLRQARRNAQRHNITATDDHDAIVQLRARGIDPFAGSEILDAKAAPAGTAVAPGPQPSAIGQLKRAAPADDSGLPKVTTADDAVLRAAKARNSEIDKMRRDIGKRRRRKMALLYMRLAFFVALPTLLVGWYFFFAATPMYSTRSEFLIDKPTAASVASQGGLGGMLGGTGIGSMQDSVTVQSWLTSRAAMMRLDEEYGFKAHFSNPEIDPLQRLTENATNEEAYALYEKRVKVGYDPTDGIIKMEVIAADPATSQTFATALMSYAEEQIDQLTLRLREDQMKGAQANYDSAEARRAEALEALLAIQIEAQQIDPVGETTSRTQQLAALEAERQRLDLDLRTRSAVARPNQAQLTDLRNRIDNLDTMMAEVRSQMTQTNADGTRSLATKNTELRIAEENYTFQANLVQQSLMQLEAARIEADRQVRYITVGVAPIAPDEATYPRAFENTILAFLVFAGLYLMLSITASILREQVSS